MKYLLIGLLAATSFMVVRAQASTPAASDSSTVVRYAYDISGAVAAIKGELENAIASEAAKQRGLDAVEHFDAAMFLERISPYVERETRGQDFSACLAFVNSDSGQAMKLLLERAGTQAETEKAMLSAPKPVFKDFVAFFNLPCYKAALKVFEAPEVVEESTTFAEELTCAFLKPASPDAFERLRRSGRCR